MGAGDISSVVQLGRFEIPGGGQSTIGGKQNNKVIVWGRITGLYTSTGLKMNDIGGVRAFGVTKADSIHLEVRTAGTAGTPTNPTTDNLFLANYLETTDKIFVCDQMGAANPTVPEESDQMVIDFLVFGDDAGAPELT